MHSSDIYSNLLELNAIGKWDCKEWYNHLIPKYGRFCFLYKASLCNELIPLGIIGKLSSKENSLIMIDKVSSIELSSLIQSLNV